MSRLIYDLKLGTDDHLWLSEPRPLILVWLNTSRTLTACFLRCPYPRILLDLDSCSLGSHAILGHHFPAFVSRAESYSQKIFV